MTNWVANIQTQMKKLSIIAVALLLAGGLSVQAGGGKGKKELTPDQQKLKQEMLTKYDTNKDGKVDKDEASKMSDADKAKLKEAHVSLGRGKKKSQ